jgi:DNA-binding NarL/FixJ family response regulator
VKKEVTKIRTVIVDEQTLFRAGLVKLLEAKPEIEIINEFSSAEDSLTFLKDNHVDLIILDIILPKMTGFKLIETIKQKYPKTKMLVLTMHKVVEYCRIALKKGALGYTLKEDDVNHLSISIDAVMNGKEYISPLITSAAAQRFFASETSLLPDVLTKTEKIILEKIAEGMSNKEVAKAQNISVRTVETHRAHILKKLKIKNTAGLVRYAVSHNMVSNNHN